MLVVKSFNVNVEVGAQKAFHTCEVLTHMQFCSVRVKRPRLQFHMISLSFFQSIEEQIYDCAASMPRSLLHIFHPFFFFLSHTSLSTSPHLLLFRSSSFFLSSPLTPHAPYALSSAPLFLKCFPPSTSLTPPPCSTLPLAFSPYNQKPHGGSASNLNMLGSPFVLLVLGPHNAVSRVQDPLSADLIR